MGQIFWITKWSKWYYKVGHVLQSGTIFIRNWSNYYKVVHYRGQMRETGKGNTFWQPTQRFIPDLPGSRQVTPNNSWKVEMLLESKEEEIALPPHSYRTRICVTCKLLFKGVSFTENCFLYWKLWQNLLEITHYEEWL